MPLSGRGAVPIIEPTPQVAADGLSLLKAADAAAVKTGFGFRLSCEDAAVAAVDKRNPDSTKALDAILVVDQRAFVRALNERGPSASPTFNVEKIECYFWEMNDIGYVTPTFRVKWTLLDPVTGGRITLEEFSFGLRYSGWSINAGKLNSLWLRGAAAAYQAATFKLAIALERLIEGNRPK